MTVSDKFPWGTVVKVHTIGTHEITEYVVGGEFKDAGKTEFGIPKGSVIDWMSADTLDEAILLPSALFMEYRQDISDLKNKFNLAVRDFAKLYPQLTQDARQRLGSMYQPEDYPQPWELTDMFGIHVEFMPVPDAEDFRVAVAQEDLDEIKANITASIAQRQSKAVQDCHGRVREVVSRIAEQCGREDGRIHDSLIGNASDLASILGGLNITADPLLAELEAGLKGLIVPVETLRTSPTTRRLTAEKATALLTKIPS